MNKQNLIVFDTEVSGLNDNAELMSFAAVLVNDDIVEETLLTFPIEASVINHPYYMDYISHEETNLVNQVNDLSRFLFMNKDYIWVGFNPSFDFKFIKKYLNKYDMKCPYIKCVDILSLANYLVLKNELKPFKRLTELCEQLSIDPIDYVGKCHLQADVRLYKDIFEKLNKILKP